MTFLARNTTEIFIVNISNLGYRLVNFKIGIYDSMRQNCPNCSSKAYKRNGYTRHGKQNHRCLDCGRQFSLEPEATMASEPIAEVVRGYLVESGPSEKRP